MSITFSTLITTSAHSLQLKAAQLISKKETLKKEVETLQAVTAQLKLAKKHIQNKPVDPEEKISEEYQDFHRRLMIDDVTCAQFEDAFGSYFTTRKLVMSHNHKPLFENRATYLLYVEMYALYNTLKFILCYAAHPSAMVPAKSNQLEDLINYHEARIKFYEDLITELKREQKYLVLVLEYNLGIEQIPFYKIEKNVAMKTASSIEERLNIISAKMAKPDASINAKHLEMNASETAIPQKVITHKFAAGQPPGGLLFSPTPDVAQKKPKNTSDQQPPAQKPAQH